MKKNLNCVIREILSLDKQELKYGLRGNYIGCNMSTSWNLVQWDKSRRLHPNKEDGVDEVRFNIYHQQLISIWLLLKTNKRRLYGTA